MLIPRVVMGKWSNLLLFASIFGAADCLACSSNFALPSPPREPATVYFLPPLMPVSIALVRASSERGFYGAFGVRTTGRRHQDFIYKFTHFDPKTGFAQVMILPVSREIPGGAIYDGRAARFELVDSDYHGNYQVFQDSNGCKAGAGAIGEATLGHRIFIPNDSNQPVVLQLLNSGGEVMSTSRYMPEVEFSISPTKRRLPKLPRKMARRSRH